MTQAENEKNLQQMYEMELHEIWQPNPHDIIIRVPGGWIYTVEKRPVFVPEPHPTLTYTSETINDDDDVMEIIEKIARGGEKWQRQKFT